MAPYYHNMSVLFHFNPYINVFMFCEAKYMVNYGIKIIVVTLIFTGFFLPMKLQNYIQP